MNQILRLLLYPLSLIYGFAVCLRNLMFDLKILKSVLFKQATICVGNLTVGGTGKTPHVEYLVNLLGIEYEVVTLSRGYKRKTKGFLLANQNSTASQLGDEPYQIHRKFPNITVAVDEKRVRGVKNIHKKKPNTEIVLLDDAFQHRYIKPGHTILLTDYNNLITRDYFLPYGRLRDSVSQLHRADMVIVTKCPSDIKPIDQRIVSKELNLYPYQDIYFTTYVYGKIKPVFSQGNFESVDVSQSDIYGLAGIANPKPFFSHLKENFKVEHTISFPDHFNFTEKKIRAIFEKDFTRSEVAMVVITTEKDASRLVDIEGLPEQIKESLFYIPIEVKFLNGKDSEFNSKIIKYVRKSKRDHGLHTK